MKLYIDIGNTNIKINFIKDKVSRYIAYNTNDSFTVDSLWQQLPDVIKNATLEKVLICSVVPNVTNVVIGVAKKYFNIKPIMIDKGIKTGIKMQVDDPKTVGSDLVALASFASSLSDNVIVVNMGTTTTISHINNRTIKGVIIMPGITSQLHAIIDNAAKIGSIEINFSSNKIGKNTADALSIGIINSHIFAIEKHIENIDQNATIIVSGGNSSKIKNYVDYKYIKEATIEGMKKIEELNE